jgi:subtilisin family serine protease
MNALKSVNLTALMERTVGRKEVAIGLIDGPVAMDHPDFELGTLREIRSGRRGGRCTRDDSAACLHGTFVAGILSAKRGSAAPAICPGCTLLVRPIFGERAADGAPVPSASPGELAGAIIECVAAGARVLNLSIALGEPSIKRERELEQALNLAARRGVIVVAAAGNQGTLGSSAITRHPWVIPVVACDRLGRPMGESNLGGSLGRSGLSAPGEQITSLGSTGRPLTFGGTSAATPFVTGAAALLWSEFPSASAAEVKFAATQADGPRRNSLVPPLLDAADAYRRLAAAQR